MSGAECIPDSEEERLRNEATSCSSADDDDESGKDYGSQRVNDALKKWYSRDIRFTFQFPENFMEVPATSANERIWLKSMEYEQVSRRLLEIEENTGQDQVPPPIIQYYKDIVDFASNKFAELQQQLITNEYHLNVLTKARDEGKLPVFLKMKPIKVRFFPEEQAISLTQKYQKILDEASAKMLGCTLEERQSYGAKLCEEAEKLSNEVEKEAMTKWMEAQGNTWNRWDHLYKVVANVKKEGGKELIQAKVPLSTCVFRTAMKRCCKTVSTLLEEKRQRKVQEETEKRKEEKKRRAAVAQATSLPRQEADKRIEQKMDDKLQPVLEKLRNMEELFQKNGGAPTAADQDGAAITSATKKRKKMRQLRAECAETSSKAKKRKHISSEQQGRVTSTSAPSSDASRRKDRPRRIESGGKSKSSGKRKKLGITTHDQE
jgi:hypothetical protein